MKLNNTISVALIALLTLGMGTAMAASTEATETMKKETMETMDGEMKKDSMAKMDEMKAEGMSKMDGEMKSETMEKMDEMKKDGMEKMDGEMNKEHKKKAMMDS